MIWHLWLHTLISIQINRLLILIFTYFFHNFTIRIAISDDNNFLSSFMSFSIKHYLIPKGLIIASGSGFKILFEGTGL